MKKIMFFAAVAAVITLASCQKEALNEAAGTESPVFTATIGTGTKTVVNATNGKVDWELNDKITISGITIPGGSTTPAIYKIKSIDKNTGEATFEIESGTLEPSFMYSAEYGSAPATAQTYSATPGKLWMTALSETTSLTFGVFCGLMEINLTKAGESVKSIAVTGTEGTYTLTCTDAQSIAEKKPFYIALPAGRYNKIVITDDADKVCTLTAASGITLEENHIKPVTFEGDKLEFLPVAAPLPGVFKVSSTKKVHFSKGNLYCSRPSSESTDWTWDFYDEQYEYIPPTNGRDRTPAADDTKIDLFTWGYNATKSIVPNGNDTNNVSRTSGNLTGTEDWGSQIGDGETWRTLTLEEWVYLLENSKYKLGVTICGKPNCMVLLPGDWDEDVISLTDFESTTEYSEETAVKWSAMEAAGAVCLPAAGRRENSNGIEFVGYFGHYWSSSAKDGLYAYSLYFSPSEIYSSEYSFAKYSYSRGKGISVRLVTDVK